MMRGPAASARARTAPPSARSRAGASEFGIHLAYCQAAGQDANDLPYGNIVCLNEHAAVLHYTDRDRVPPKAARSFLIDAGASFGGYACDITPHLFRRPRRRVPGDDRCSRCRAAQDVRCRARRRRLQAYPPRCAPGAGRILRDAGILRIAADDAVARGVSSAFFPHGIGHGIGLQVHDVAGFAASDAGGTIPKPEGHPYLRLTRTLARDGGDHRTRDLLHRHAAGRTEGEGPRRHRRLGIASRHSSRTAASASRTTSCTDGAPINLTREAFSATLAIPAHRRACMAGVCDRARHGWRAVNRRRMRA